ncbi:MAG: hypothetical protein EP326_11205 [Deltaproteobacteria bacterium]|nr:MAG: hypothetical protein EP326_11205 [Deltaproteobacteria bacterium]TNF29733.1 MAG: hypothetical protein EP319_06680 [Deltaproteobacteria bacterium]
MKTLTCLALGLLFSATAMANTASQNKAEFCADRESAEYYQKLLLNKENRLSFTNHGGLANGGVCWWHSRFTRKAAYLAIYRPELPKPSKEEAYDIVLAIRMGNKVVEVPGYRNLYEFSRDYKDVIQQRLERWQVGDGFMRQQWTVGLWGASQVSADEMRERMDELYEEVVENNDVAYQVLQIKGVVAHAWLVVDMERTANGYELQVIDSNYMTPTSFSYTHGMTNLRYPYWGQFVPRTGKKSEMNKMKKIVSKFCKNI